MSDFTVRDSVTVATTDRSAVRSLREDVRDNRITSDHRRRPLSRIERTVIKEHTIREHTIERERITETKLQPAPIVHIEPTDVRVHVRHDLRPPTAIRPVEVCMLPPPLGDASRLANEPVHAVDATGRIEAEQPLGKRLTPLVPPWRLPLPTPCTTVTHVIKYSALRPDQMGKGAMIDLFL